MGQRKWLGSRVRKDKYHHSEDPKYGQAFQIVAIQLESIDNDFTDWIENGEIQFGDITISFSEYTNKLRKMGETDVDWKKMKNKISDEVCGDLNTLINKYLDDVTRVKDVVAYKVHYLGDKKGINQIL